MNLTPERLAEIRAYCEKATAGPWEAGNGAVWNCIVNGEGNSPAEICYQMRDQDADFIANARTDLPAAVDEISRLRQELATGHEIHNAACIDLSRKGHEIDTLRQQLAEAKGENADLRERLQRQREQIQRQPAHVCGPDENCGVCIECALMAQGAELERVSQDLQQANAASGADTKRLDWLQKNYIRVDLKDGQVWVQSHADLRTAITAAMEGSRTK